MKKQFQYHAFISYSHKDKDYAIAIQKSIETLGLPFYKRWKPNVYIFRDERKIPLSGNLTEEILKGLRDSNYLIIIASKNSGNSTWVKEEILNWHKLNQDDSGFITNFNLILIDDIIEWDYVTNDFDRLKTTALPSFDVKIFKQLPLWANLQQYRRKRSFYTNSPNYKWEIAKIKGLLLDKKPDEIIDEASKGKGLLRIIISGFIFILLLLTTLAYYQRREALIQRNNAENETRKQKALYLLSESTNFKNIDPTKALNLLKIADSLYPENEEIFKSIYSIYNTRFINKFYKKDIITPLIYPKFQISSDKEYLLIFPPSNSVDKNILYLLNINGIIKYQVELKEYEILDASFLPNSNNTIILFTGYGENKESKPTVILINDINGNAINRLEFTTVISAMTIFPDGKSILCAEYWHRKDSKEENVSDVYIVKRNLTDGSVIYKHKIDDYAIEKLILNPAKPEVAFNAADSAFYMNLLSGKRMSLHIEDEIDKHGIIEISPNGNYVLYTSPTSTNALLFNSSGKHIANLLHNDIVTSACFSKSGNEIITASEDSIAKVWDLRGKLKLSFNTKSASSNLYFLDSNKVISFSNKTSDGVTIYDLNGNIKSKIEIDRIVYSTLSLESELVSATPNHIRFWDLTNDKNGDPGNWIWNESYLLNYLNRNLSIKKNNHSFETKFEMPITHIISNKNRVVVFTATSHNGDFDYFLEKKTDSSKVYFLLNNTIERSFTLPGYSIRNAVFNKDADKLLIVCSDGKARLLNIRGDSILTLKSNVPEYANGEEVDYITKAYFSANDDIITSTGTGYLIYWDKFGNKLKINDIAISEQFKPSTNGYSSSSSSFHISKDNKLMALFYDDQFFVLIDQTKKTYEKIVYSNISDYDIRANHRIYDGQIFGNNQYLLTVNYKGVDIWSLKTKNIITHLNCQPSSFTISPNEDYVIISQGTEHSITYPLPKGLKEWLKKIKIASISLENKTTYNLDNH